MKRYLCVIFIVCFAGAAEVWGGPSCSCQLFEYNFSRKIFKGTLVCEHGAVVGGGACMEGPACSFEYTCLDESDLSKCNVGPRII